jgi:hypothetical protein
MNVFAEYPLSFLRTCRDLGINLRDMIDALEDTGDYASTNYRVIADRVIDEIQVEELQADAYMLGCFNAWFISGVSDLSLEIVEALQSGEQYEALGQYLIDNNRVEEMQADYVTADGYGHHFAHYDGHDLGIAGFHIFRVN